MAQGPYEGAVSLVDENKSPIDAANPLPVTVTGGVSLLTLTVPAGTVVGDVMYLTGTADTAARALATALATMPARAIVVELVSATLARVQLGGQAQVLSGLTPGASYWVSKTTAGKLTASLAAFVAGDVVQLVGQAVDPVTLALVFGAPFQL